MQHLWIVVAAAITLSGCIAPVKHEMTTDYPAAMIRTVGAPPVIDGRARFRQIFCRLLKASYGNTGFSGGCEEALLKLSDEPVPVEPFRPLPERTTRFRVLIVPGFLNECFTSIALPFEEAIQSLDDKRVTFEVFMVSGHSSSEANAVSIAEKIAALVLDPDERLVLIGHSKGAVDILQALVDFPEASRRVSAVISVAGAINGTPLAERVDEIAFELARNFLPDSCDEGDGGALDSLRPATRLTWLAANPLPASVRYFSLAAFTERDHINQLLRTGYDQLQIYSPRNDGLLLSADQMIPGGSLLGYANADHWSVALPLEKNNRLIAGTIRAPHKFPRHVLLQAMLLYVAEATEISTKWR